MNSITVSKTIIITCIITITFVSACIVTTVLILVVIAIVRIVDEQIRRVGRWLLPQEEPQADNPPLLESLEEDTEEEETKEEETKEDIAVETATRHPATVNSESMESDILTADQANELFQSNYGDCAKTREPSRLRFSDDNEVRFTDSKTEEEKQGHIDWLTDVVCPKVDINNVHLELFTGFYNDDTMQYACLSDDELLELREEVAEYLKPFQPKPTLATTLEDVVGPDPEPIVEPVRPPPRRSPRLAAKRQKAQVAPPASSSRSNARPSRRCARKPLGFYKV